MTQRPIVYIDMDNTLVNFRWGLDRLTDQELNEYKGRIDEVPGYFRELPPLPGAIESFHRISEHYETFILSTAPWENPSAWKDKLLWIKQHLPEKGHKRLILSHNKHLNRGDYLIDDRDKNGADRFRGELIGFGSEDFPDWEAVIKYLIK